ncbi:MAG: roadblock/LC7 domain-containing protein [Planctomycetes bacterium]|nr:roadblock/LC7 domain-containing protein [Planctomycetota bacterium]
MKQFLETLARIPGVRMTALATPDGVPIWHLALADESRAAQAQPIEGDPEGGQGLDIHALSALATNWVVEVGRCCAPLSWDTPRRLVLRAARGTLLVQEAPGAVLVVLLEGGVRPEDLRLPMDSVVARMQRHLRSIETIDEQRVPGAIPGPLPFRDTNGASGFPGAIPAPQRNFGSNPMHPQTDNPGSIQSGD